MNKQLYACNTQVLCHLDGGVWITGGVRNCKHSLSCAMRANPSSISAPTQSRLYPSPRQLWVNSELVSSGRSHTEVCCSTASPLRDDHMACAHACVVCVCVCVFLCVCVCGCVCVCVYTGNINGTVKVICLCWYTELLRKVASELCVCVHVVWCVCVVYVCVRCEDVCVASHVCDGC